ncbi:CENPI protein, partial [Acromyrmex heyeri]
MGLGEIAYSFLSIFFSTSHNPDDLIQFCVIFVSNFSRMVENETRATCLKYIKALNCKCMLLTASNMFLSWFLLNSTRSLDKIFCIVYKCKFQARYIARLIYVLTKPEDVSRRDVTRLLTLQKSYSKPPTHIIALLSLFKSYKPELVPEKIESVNIESVWKPIPEVIRLALEDARDRAEIQQSCQSIQPFFKWNVMQDLKVKKRTKALLPSVGYFHMGSSIFKDKDAKSIFDINYINVLAFILENGKFSKEEMDKFLTMTIEFSRYMQEGILIVKLFFDEYLYYNSGEHLPRLLDLLQWMTSISVTELRENILIHVQNIFYESSLNMKCEIIRSVQKLITNFFVRQELEEQDQYASSFLQQGRLEDLAEIVPVITTILENLIVCGLNIHNYNVILLSECLAFYEEICTLESRSHVLSWTLPPPAVIYGAFITKSCAILSRICRLLLRYREMSPHLRQIMPSDIYEEKIRIISIYANDIYKALWCDEPFSENGNLLKNFSKKVRSDLRDCDLETLLNISNHYAILAYRCTLSKRGLKINTKEVNIKISITNF